MSLLINGIRITTCEGIELAYKFSAATGRCRNLTVFVADAECIKLFRQALYFALTGTIQPLVRSVRLHFHDSSGDYWVISRTPSDNRLFKNKQELVHDAEASLKRSLLDLPEEGFLLKSRDYPLVDLFRVFVSGSDLLVRAQKMDDESSSEASELSKQIDKTKERLGREVGHALKLDYDLTRSQIEKLIETIIPLGQKYLNLSELLGTFDGYSEKTVSETYLENLSHEVKLIERIKSQFEPIQKNSQMIRVKKEKRDQLVSMLSSFENNHLSLDNRVSIESYEKALNILCRLYAYQALSHSFRKAIGRVENNIKPTISRYLDSMTGLLKNDRAILNELEFLLNSLTEHHRSINAANAVTLRPVWQRLSDSFAVKLNKFTGDEQTKQSTSKDKDTSKSFQFELAEHDKILANSQEIINKILTALGEVHSNLDVVRQSAEWNLNSFYDRYEQVIKDSAKVRNSWQNAAKILGVDVEIKIDDFIRILGVRSQYHQMRQELRDINASLDTYQNELKELVALLNEWYRVTNSHKPANLNQLSVVFRETKGIIAYAEAKNKKLYEGREEKLLNQVAHKNFDHLSSLLVSIKQDWEKQFAAMGIIPPKISSELCARLPSLLSHMSALLSLDEGEGVSRVGGLDQALSELSVDVPVSLFDFCEMDSDSANLDYLQSIIAKSSPHGYGILLTDSESVKGALSLHGPSLSQKVEITKKTSGDKVKLQDDSSKKQSGFITEREEGNAQVSDKARAVLEIFRQR